MPFVTVPGSKSPSRDAIYRACLPRFRPIMMTTLAAMLGGLPRATGFGAGSELRRPRGITIVGGLLVSQALTLFTMPVIYLYLGRLGRLTSLDADSLCLARLSPQRGGVAGRTAQGAK